MRAYDFIEAMYNCTDIEYQYKSTNYMLEMWRQSNGHYSVRIDSIEAQSKNLFFVENLVLQDCIEAFETAKIFDNQTIYEAQHDIEILYG